MKILAFNGSPKGTKSNTDRILQPFLQGAAEAGAQCETIYTVGLKVHDCRGCFACWRDTPGECVYQDDMNGILTKIRESDLVIWATPLYYYGMTAGLQRVMERTLPLNLPSMVKEGDKYTHPARYGKKPRHMLISNCGFPDRSRFDPLLATFNEITGSRGLAAVILCPAGELLGQADLEGSFGWYLQACRKAGREIVELGSISQDTAATLECNLVPTELYVKMANSVQGEAGQNGYEPVDEESSLQREGDNWVCKSMAPPRGTDHIRDVIAGMALNFRPEAGDGLNAVYQFAVSGGEPGEYFLVIEDGLCQAFEGRHPRANIVINTPSEVWMSVSRGTINGSTALMEGQYSFTGDLNLLIKMGDLFGGAVEMEKESGLEKEKPGMKGPIRISGMHWLTMAFIPWTFYWVFSGSQSLWVSVVPLVISLAILFYRNHYMESSWMDRGAPVFFVVAALLQYSVPDITGAYRYLFSNLTLAGIWIATLMTDIPLTARYSKYNYPTGFESNPLFVKINLILTAFWGLVFIILGSLALFAPDQPQWRALWVGMTNLLLIPAFLFTKRFPEHFIAHRLVSTAKNA